MTGRPRLSTAEVRAELELVPDHTSFPPVDDLVAGARAVAAADRSGLVRLEQVGTSAGGEPIECLIIDPTADTVPDRRHRSAVVIGFPHPNEPVGGLTTLHLATRLLEDDDLRRSLDLRWYLVPCIDPDGARLNQQWFARPGSRADYLRGFFRPPGDEQVEWNFPLRYKNAVLDDPIPETRAMMGLIDRAEPELLVSLHNSEAGGMYFYLSRSVPPLHEALTGLADLVGLPLDVGEPEAPDIPVLAPAIYLMASITEIYDRIEAAGGPTDLIAGASSADYSRRFGTLNMVCEVPQWLADEAGDDTPTGVSYARVLTGQAARFAEAGSTIDGLLVRADAGGVPEGRFLRAARLFNREITDLVRTTSARATEPGSDRPATVAEVWTARDAVDAYRGRILGMLVRALRSAVEDSGPGTDPPADLIAALAEGEATLDVWAAETVATSGERPAPVRALVAGQYLSILETASRL